MGLADDILKRKAPKAPKAKEAEKKQSPAELAIGKTAEANAVYADTEPTIANRELARFATDQIVHVDNLDSISPNVAITSPLNPDGSVEVGGDVTAGLILPAITKGIPAIVDDGAGNAALLQLDGIGNLKVEIAAQTNPVSENLAQINGVNLSSPSADSPVGTETAQINRTINRKRQILETTTPLIANATFTGPWHDTELTGTNFVCVTGSSNVAAAATVGLQLQESEDQISLRGIASNGAALVTRAAGFIRSRYWRVTYTNGASPQASFSLYATESSNGPVAQPSANVVGPTDSLPVTSSVSSSQLTENAFAESPFTSAQGTPGAIPSSVYGFGGAWSGTTNTALRGWSRRRMPTLFKTMTATAAGSTVVWTPSANNKFRLQCFMLQLTNNASLAVAGVLTIQFFDAAAAMPIAYDIFVPNAAGALIGEAIKDGWVYLGDFGILSAAANNPLNINLSAALATGNVRIIAGGTEE